MTSTPDPLPEQPLSPPEFLELALQEAGIMGRVEVEDDALALYLPPGCSEPHLADEDAVRAWLTEVGIPAGVHTDQEEDIGFIAVAPLTATDAHRIATLLLEDGARDRAALAQLTAALDRHSLPATVWSHRAQTKITIHGDEPAETATGLAAALGAPNIADGLKLHRPKGIDRLAARLQLLLTGALGPRVDVDALPECVHDCGAFVLRLSAEQAVLLAGRLLAAPVLPGG